MRTAESVRGGKELRMHRACRTRVSGVQIERTVDHIRDVNTCVINTFRNRSKRACCPGNGVRGA